MDVTGAAVLDLAAARRLAAAASVPAPAVEAAWVCRGQPTAAALHALGEAAGLTGDESEARELAEACYAFARCVALRGGAEGAAEAAFPVGVAAPAELCAIARERGATWAVAAAARAPAPPRLLRAACGAALSTGAPIALLTIEAEGPEERADCVARAECVTAEMGRQQLGAAVASLRECAEQLRALA